MILMLNKSSNLNAHKSCLSHPSHMNQMSVCCKSASVSVMFTAAARWCIVCTYWSFSAAGTNDLNSHILQEDSLLPPHYIS